MTSIPDCVPARSWAPIPAGRHAATDPVTAWALAARDRERDAYRALYEALYGPPPPGSRQEATA